jgi:hypothetical protein
VSLDVVCRGGGEKAGREGRRGSTTEREEWEDQGARRVVKRREKGAKEKNLNFNSPPLVPTRRSHPPVVR